MTKYIYFVQLGKAGPIKIGTAMCVKRRMKELQVSAVEQLYLLATINGMSNNEKFLHRKLKEDRIRGEWFNPSEQVLDVIESVKSGELVFEAPTVAEFGSQNAIIFSIEMRASALGVKVYKICESVGIAPSTYYRWKQGTPANFAKIAPIQLALSEMENAHGNS